MWPFKRKPDPTFTGNCMVYQYCHLHGDVPAYLDNDIGWPADFDLKRS